VRLSQKAVFADAFVFLTRAAWQAVSNVPFGLLIPPASSVA